MFAGDETKPVEQRNSGVLRELDPAHLAAQLQQRWKPMTFADAKYIFDNVADTGRPMPESATALVRKRKLEKKAEKEAKKASLAEKKAAKRKAADYGGRKAKKAKCTPS